MAIEAVDLDTLDNPYALPVDLATQEGELNGRTVQPSKEKALPVAIDNINEVKEEDRQEKVAPLSEKTILVAKGKSFLGLNVFKQQNDDDNNTQGCSGCDCC